MAAPRLSSSTRSGAPAWLADLSSLALAGGLFMWIFLAMLWSAFGVVHHAEALAELLGEPYGTLILTMAAVTIEVALIASIMLTVGDNPSLARDTMMAVIMIVLNGLVGLALLAGGLRHGEQEFNLQGARSFLEVLMTLATMALILPTFTTSTDSPTFDPLQAALFSAITIALYATFLAIQTYRHRSFFVDPAQHEEAAQLKADPPRARGSIAFHAIFLILTILPIVLLSKMIAALVDFGLSSLDAPAALGGVLVAVLVLSPEGLATVRAAQANRLQRSVNICLGAALSTIGLTVPAVLLIGLATGQPVILGLGRTDMVLLVLTLILSILTFRGRTNMLQGAVHLVVFFVYLVLIFSP